MIETKKLTVTGIALFLIIATSSFECRRNDLPYTRDGNWINRADFAGLPVGEAVVFVIGNYAYVGTGVDVSHPNIRLNNMYRFDPTGNGGWTQIADFGGRTRNAAVGFSVRDKGYIATGYDGGAALNDCWEYDPVNNAWTAKAPLGNGTINSSRYDAIGFGIGDFGYVGTGYSGSNWLEDLWQYDPQSDSWTERRGIGKKRSAAICMLYNNRAYVFGGSSNGKLLTDGWVFDPDQPDSAAWTALNHISNYSDQSFDDGYSNLTRNNAVCFVIGSKGYMTTGNSGTINGSTWEYDFSADVWQPRTPFYGSPREGAVGFSVNNRGFVSTGFSGSTGYDDTWEFSPEETQNFNQ